jgi:predicted ArsR family transcriptional regulator
MESTKQQVLHLLQVRGGATVTALAEALGVGQASVRRHLDHLRVDGLADVRTERHGVGRPAFVFYPTEEAEERMPTGYSRLLSRMYRELGSLREADVSGRDGAEVLRTVFEGVAQQVAQEHEVAVAAGELGTRVEKTAEVLKGEGIVDDWSTSDNAYKLTNTACPYRSAALATHGPCELDRRTIELLVSAPVQQVSRIVDGQARCEYVVAMAHEHEVEQPERGRADDERN